MVEANTCRTHAGPHTTGRTMMVSNGRFAARLSHEHWLKRVADRRWCMTAVVPVRARAGGRCWAWPRSRWRGRPWATTGSGWRWRTRGGSGAAPARGQGEQPGELTLGQGKRGPCQFRPSSATISSYWCCPYHPPASMREHHTSALCAIDDPCAHHAGGDVEPIAWLERGRGGQRRHRLMGPGQGGA